jgi:hypothetical protein
MASHVFITERGGPMSTIGFHHLMHRVGLMRMFQENFVKYEQHVDPDVRSAAPEVRIAAE